MARWPDVVATLQLDHVRCSMLAMDRPITARLFEFSSRYNPLKIINAFTFSFFLFSPFQFPFLFLSLCTFIPFDFKLSLIRIFFLFKIVFFRSDVFQHYFFFLPFVFSLKFFLFPLSIFLLVLLILPALR